MSSQTIWCDYYHLYCSGNYSTEKIRCQAEAKWCNNLLNSCLEHKKKGMKKIKYCHDVENHQNNFEDSSDEDVCENDLPSRRYNFYKKPIVRNINGLIISDDARGFKIAEEEEGLQKRDDKNIKEAISLLLKSVESFAKEVKHVEMYLMDV